MKDHVFYLLQDGRIFEGTSAEHLLRFEEFLGLQLAAVKGREHLGSLGCSFKLGSFKRGFGLFLG